MKKYIAFLEELALNAWPAYRTELYDGWLLRFSHEYTHRTNCVNIIGESHHSMEEKIAYCEQEYERMGTASIFKINPLFHSKLEDSLIKRGYLVEHKTDTYTLDLSDCPIDSVIVPTVTLCNQICPEWITTLFDLNHTVNTTHRRIVPSMYHAIPRDTITAQIILDGHPVATGLGIIERDYIGIYAIYVAEAYRGQGLARAIISSLLQAARQRGIHHAYLQVVYENTIAKKLYESLGFRYCYSYWFRVKRSKTQDSKKK